MAHAPQLFIENQWRDARGGATFNNLNPATEKLICECPNAQAEDVDDAVAAARKCFESPEWGLKSTGPQRAACLRAMGQAIEDDKDAFARLESEDCGKPINESVEDMDLVVEVFRWIVPTPKHRRTLAARRANAPNRNRHQAA